MDILRIKDENGVWQNVPALVGPPGKNGAQGEPGPAGSDGFSPIATVTQTDTGATISIQDATGTTTATITNGQDGANGVTGPAGADGLPALTYGKIKETTVTPTVGGVTNFIETGDLPPSLFNRTPVVGDRFILLALRTTTGQTFILECEITLVTTYVASKNISVVETTGAAGAQGEKGDKGDSGGQGPQGPRGNPGFSPIATVTQTDTGATISIQDATGTTTATITNGQDGAPGADGYTPIKGTDYWTESDKAEIVQEAASSIPIATTEVAGKVKPDGTTVTITEDGTISAVGGSGGASTAADVSFDNTDTGLTATDVQSALEEIDAGIISSEEVQSMIDADITDLYRARGEGLIALMMEDRKYFQNIIMLSNVPTPEEVYETLKKYGTANRGVGIGTVSLSSSELRSCVTSLDGISAIKILRIDNDGEVSAVTSTNINGLYRFSIYIVVPYVLLISDDSSASMSQENLAKFREYIGLPKLSTVDSRITALETTINSLVDGNEVSY